MNTIDKSNQDLLDLKYMNSNIKSDIEKENSVLKNKLSIKKSVEKDQNEAVVN